mgnify:CR=1 FL=1
MTISPTKIFVSAVLLLVICLTNTQEAKAEIVCRIPFVNQDLEIVEDSFVGEGRHPRLEILARQAAERDCEKRENNRFTFNLCATQAVCEGKPDPQSRLRRERMGRDTVENSELIEIARAWLKESKPSSPPPGSWRKTSKNVMSGRLNGKPWLYAELQRVNHGNGWRAQLVEVDLNASYLNVDGKLQKE